MGKMRFAFVFGISFILLSVARGQEIEIPVPPPIPAEDYPVPAGIDVGSNARVGLVHLENPAQKHGKAATAPQLVP